MKVARLEELTEIKGKQQTKICDNCTGVTQSLANREVFIILLRLRAIRALGLIELSKESSSMKFVFVRFFMTPTNIEVLKHSGSCRICSDEKLLSPSGRLCVMKAKFRRQTSMLMLLFRSS